VLQRFLEDRLADFVHGYREDLGPGPPAGARTKWPMAPRERPFNRSLAQSGEVPQAHSPIKLLPKPSEEPPETGLHLATRYIRLGHY
jgi:hypothetical protein